MPSERTHGVMYDGLYTFAVRAINIALAAGLGILTARLLGPAGRGIYALPGVEATLAASVFGGLGSATSFFLLNRKPNRAFLLVVFSCALLWVLVAAAAIIPLSVLAGARWAAFPAIAILPALALINIGTGYALGIKQVRYSSTIAALQTFLTICAIALGLFLVAKTPGVAIIAWIAATTAAGLVTIAFVLRDARTRIQGQDRVSFSEYAHFSIKISLVNLVTLLNYRGDMYIVALALPPAALGMYGVAVSIAESLLVPTQVASLVASPHIASMEVSEAARVTARCVRNNLLIALITCGVLFVFARPIIGLLYGPSFLPVVPSFDVLLAGVVVLSLGSPVSSYFTLKLGRPQVALCLALGSAVICLGVTIALLHPYGMLGAAIGSSAGYFAGQTAGLWYFCRTARVRPSEILVPTMQDLAVYGAFAVRLVKDGRRLLRPVH